MADTFQDRLQDACDLSLVPQFPMEELTDNIDGIQAQIDDFGGRFQGSFAKPFDQVLGFVCNPRDVRRIDLRGHAFDVMQGAE